MTTAVAEPASSYSTPRIHRAVIAMINRLQPKLQGMHLDIGSGNGELIRLVQQNFQVQSRACDYTSGLMEIPDQPVEVVDLNHQRLPYDDDSFDLVTFTEVVEHLENHHDVCREIRRVLRPGGLLIVTTPNILNLKSRLRFLFFGFWNLFGPLHVRESEKHTTGGHINPISYFYLAHTLSDAGLQPAGFDVDQFQRSSLLPLLLLYLPIRWMGFLAFRKEREKYRTVDAHNSGLVKDMNRIPMLLGRTIVVAARKP